MRRHMLWEGTVSQYNSNSTRVQAERQVDVWFYKERFAAQWLELMRSLKIRKRQSVGWIHRELIDRLQVANPFSFDS